MTPLPAEPAFIVVRLEPEHPETDWSLNNLAVVLDALGDLDSARVLYQRDLAIRETRLGPNHQPTCRSQQTTRQHTRAMLRLLPDGEPSQEAGPPPDPLIAHQRRLVEMGGRAGRRSGAPIR
jgi:Tetratricopeptide repeat